MKLIEKILNEIALNIDSFSIKNDMSANSYKKFTELSILIEYCFKNSNLIGNTDLQKIKNRIVKDLNNTTADTIFDNLYMPFHLVDPYVSIRSVEKIEKYENYIKLISENELFPIELPPHREMEWYYFLYKINKVNKVSIPINCIVNKKIHLPIINRDLAYGLTHALLYAFDFGFTENKPKISNLNEIKFVIENLIIKFYHENDIDVLIELAINYISLVNYCDINFDILKIINNSILKTKFIEFEWDKRNLIDKKYHTFFVLGILINLIETKIFDTKISSKKRQQLKNVYKDSILKSYDEKLTYMLDNNIEKMKEFERWEIINNISEKQIDISEYLNYSKKYGNDDCLEQEIKYQIKLLIQRNELNILWEREFSDLEITNNEVLKSELSYQYKESLKSILETMSI